MTVESEAVSSAPDVRAQAFVSREDMPERIELPVTGELPAWLSGQLLRNGPGRWGFDGREVNHWFDGMALLHSFEIADGRVHYRNRYVESRAYKAFKSDGEIGFSEFATDPCRSRFERIQSIFSPQLTDNPAINALKFGGRFIALSETPMAYEFNPETLETIGIAYENPDLFATAHPHADQSGAMFNLSCKFGPRSSQSFFRLDPTSLEAKRVAKLHRQHPTYQHSFGISKRWLILTEFPFAINPLDVIKTGRPFIENFEFDAEAKTVITLVDRKTGEVGGVWQAEPGFCFHHVNAWEEGDEVVVDLCRFDDASVVEALYLANLRGGEYPAEARPYLHRYRLIPSAAYAHEQRLSETPIELPRINYRANNTKPYSFVYGVGLAEDGVMDRVVKIDVQSGDALTWQEPNCFAGEPVFVATPDGTAEDDGVLLSLVLDGDAQRSMLLVLDARDLTELARAEISAPVPSGFHGSFVR